jgi:hypothetical protein
VGPLADCAAQKCRSSEPGMNIIQPVIREWTSHSLSLSLSLSRRLSLFFSAGPTGHEPYGSAYAVWAVWPMRDEVRGPLCSNFVPNKTNSLKGAAARIRPPLRRELIAKFYVNYVTSRITPCGSFRCKSPRFRDAHRHPTVLKRAGLRPPPIIASSEHVCEFIYCCAALH